MQRKMGFLDPGAETEDLPEQSVNLPLWFCLGIDSVKRSNFKIDVPDIYKNVYTEICKAEAQVVNLSKLNKYFYELGSYVSRFDRNGLVAAMVHDTFRKRMMHLQDLCYEHQQADVKNDHGLEFLENELYKVGSTTTEKFNKWLQDEGAGSNIEASSVVLKHRKRKRENCEEDDIL